ncbi:ABC transporter substrate-binding protein [Microlunatus sp. GCM10028923]|uniref:ABC transporter substrate-binding protein n=1 Tax=Microlunatus sp. GCM10028923 TaxID=3273400 RepID=UPI00361B3324
MDVSRRTLLTALGLGALGTAAGCSGGTGTTGSADGPASGEITFLTAIFEGATGKEILEGQLLPKFKESHPDVTVKVDYTNYSALNEKITTGLASGLMPDVLTLGVGWVDPFAYKKAIAPLPDELGTRYDYQERVLKPSRFDGKLYALPIVLDTRFVAYRKDFFDEAGIKATPKNFTELRAVAKELTRSEGGKLSRVGLDPFSIDLRQCWETFLFAAGGELFSPDGRQVLFNSEAGIGALQYFLDLITDGSASFDLKTAQGQPSTLQQGSAAMMMVNNSLWINIEDENPELIKDDRIGAFLLADTRPAMLQGGTLVAQSATSKNAAAARALVEFLGSPDVILPACEQRGAVPAVADLADSEYVKGNPFVDFALSNLDQAFSEGGTPAWMEIREKIKPTLESAVVGQQSAQQAIEQLAGIANEAIGRLG